MQGPSKAEGKDSFRPDIEGLRGIAVVLVVLFHSSLVVGIPGGFIGVDVFFVISGFLITGLLLRERERSGRISLTAFYARRVRRLLPAAVVALACTLVASFIVLAPLDRASVALDAAAAALSVGNIRFAMAEGDYFASIAAPSPLLHFWSLAVEEQFYFVWPALVLAASRGHRPRLGAGTALVIVLAVSLAANIVVSATAVNWAFYSLPTRAWQLSLGGLIAVAAGPLARVPVPLTAALGWVALPAIVGAAMVFDGSLAYPGAWALVPTLAAGALIVGGRNAYGPGRLLALPPIRFLGRISYSLYLWHWPVLVLPMIALEAEPPAAMRAALVAVAVGAAWLSWRYVEEPFRTGFPTLARHPRRTVLAGGSAVLAVVLASGSFAMAAEQVPELMPEPAMAGAAVELAGLDELDQLELSDELDEFEESDESQASDESDEDSSAGLGRAFRPSLPRTYLAGRRRRTWRAGGQRVGGQHLRSDDRSVAHARRAPAEGRPATPVQGAGRRGSAAVRWLPRVRGRAGAPGLCLRGSEGQGHGGAGGRLPRGTVVPRPAGRGTAPALAAAHVHQGRVPVPGHARPQHRPEARVLGVRGVPGQDDREAPEAETRPHHREHEPVRDPSRSHEGRFHGIRVEALARVIEALPGRVVLLGDTPDARRDVPSCLSRHTRDVRRCSVPVKAAFVGKPGKLERLASRATGAGLINLSARVCRADPCPVVVDGMIVFRDSRHLTATFAASLAPDLESGLLPYLEPPPQASSSPPAATPSPMHAEPAPDPTGLHR